MPNRPRILRSFALALLVVPLHWAATAGAAEQGMFKLCFSTNPDDPAPRETLLVRPNLTQNYYLFVQNLSDKTEPVTVDIFAGEKSLPGAKPIAGASVTVTAKAKAYTPVPLGKPPVPGDKPAATPAPEPAADKTPPPLLELKDATGLTFDLHGKDGDKRVDLQELFFPVKQPSEYVDFDSGSYSPKALRGLTNQLVIKVRAKPEFQGGRCRVDVALSPDRIPGYKATPVKEGKLGGYLEGPGDELTLTVNNLQFTDSGTKPGEKTDGLVYLTIDGYERAFIFKSTFPRSGSTGSTLTRITNLPFANLKAAAQADPAKPYPVAVELDNVPPTAVIEIALDLDGNEKFSKKGGGIQTFGQGNRRTRLFVNPAFPGGALQLNAVVADWSKNLDVAAVFGPHVLRFRLLADKEQIAKADTPDDPKKLEKFLTGASDESVTVITSKVVFDGAPPQNLKFVDFPKTLKRGDPLPVKAMAVDTESGIKEVVFYVGKPGPDGKMPPNTEPVIGKLSDPEKNVWTASLDAPTDKKGKTEVTAQFTSGAGLVATETVKIELVDSGTKEAAGGGKASIAGKVLQGGRAQPDVPVQLRDAAGGVLDTTVSSKEKGKEGEFAFKDLAPATYRVYAGKTGDNTKGETVVGVKAAEEKKGVEVNLLR